MFPMLETVRSPSRFLVISAPPASGKTSLLKLFTNTFASLGGSIIYISFLDAKFSARELLKSRAGIDLDTRSASVDEATPLVVMIDDAQDKYDDESFWRLLIKDGVDWIPRNVTFFFASSYFFSGGPQSPAEFSTITRLVREDLMLDQEEFSELINIYLHQKLRHESAVEVIRKECNGHIGAVKVIVNAVNRHFLKDKSPSVSDVINYLMSSDITRCQELDRCFSSQIAKPVDNQLLKYLQICILQGCPFDLSNLPQKSSADEECFMKLRKCGILVTNYRTGLTSFSSPLTRRFMTAKMFPQRSLGKTPSSLRELITSALKKLSASALRDSTSNDRFPKEAVFQHLIMSAFLECTPIGCLICPELSEVFPDGSNSATDEKITGEIDFFIDGNLRWGVELLVNGNQISNHVERFAQGGKYSLLQPNDYVVIDFRPGPVSKKIRHFEKRVTVFYEPDFSTCSCVFGFEDNPVVLQLAM